MRLLGAKPGNILQDQTQQVVAYTQDRLHYTWELHEKPTLSRILRLCLEARAFGSQGHRARPMA